MIGPFLSQVGEFSSHCLLIGSINAHSQVAKLGKQFGRKRDNMPKKEKKPKGVINTFLFLVNMTGVIMIVISNFVSFCQLQVSTDPADSAMTQKMKDLGFAGPGFGVTEGGQVTNEWQKNFPDKCPPPPSGYLETDVTYKGHVQPGKFWRPVLIAVLLFLLDFLAFLFLKKQKGGRVFLPA